jgi:hypothetical protein
VRRAAAAGLAALLVAGTAASATGPGTAAIAGALTAVRVHGGGWVALPDGAAAGAHASRAGWSDLPAGSVAPAATGGAGATATAGAGAAGGPGDEAPAYPPAAPRAPGTAVTLGGGNCDGYAARDATISPLRVSVGTDGQVWWTDRDVVVARHGSALVRTVAGGRVRTLGPVLPPATGRFNRVGSFDEFSPHAVPDGSGGVYVNSSAAPSPGYDDQPRSGYVQRLRADGSRSVVAGGGEHAAADDSLNGSAPARDGRATERWLGSVHALGVLDGRGVLLAEQVGGLHDVVRFVNTGAAAVTFYRGTTAERTVPPGGIATLTGQSTEWQAPQMARDAAGLNRPAAEMNNLRLSDVEYRDGLLYALDVQLFNEGDGGPTGNPADYVSVWVVNLGLDGRARTVYGTAVAPGEAAIVAGTNLPSVTPVTGDGVPARGAELRLNYSGYNGGIAVGPDLTLYLAETRAHRIRAVDPATGLITTVAGIGTPGYDGEGTVAKLSRLHNPVDVAVAPDGSLLITEPHLARIRRVTRDGRLETVVGRGPTPCGDGHRAAPAASPYGGAFLGAVTDVAVDSRGNRYVSDIAYNTVRRIRPDGTIDRTFGRPTPCAAGRWGDIDGDSCAPYGQQSADAVRLGDLAFAEPTYLLVDAYDNLYVVDVDRVRYLNVGTKNVTVHAMPVPPGEARTVLALPDRFVRVTTPVATTYRAAPLGDLALDDRGNLYLADPLLNVVYRMGRCFVLTPVAGNGRPSRRGDEGDGGSALAASITPGGSLAYDRARDALLVVDLPSGAAPRVRAVNLSAKTVRLFGRTLLPDRIGSVAGGGARCRSRDTCSYGDGGTALDAGISAPSVELAPTGELYVAERTDRIRVVRPDGVVATVAGPAVETDGAPRSDRQAVNPAPRDGYSGDGGPALAATFWLHRTRITYQRRTLSVNVGGTRAPFELPIVTFDGQSGLALAPDGDLLVADAARLRAVRDVAHAPLRLGRAPVAVAPPDFTPPLLLTGGEETSPDGVGSPNVVVDGGTAYVTAARGAGRGCALWAVDTAVRRTAPPPTDALGLGAGGRACDLAAESGALLLGTPVADAGGVVARSADRGASWSVAGAASSSGAGLRLGAGKGETGLVHGTSDGFGFATSEGGTAFAERGRVAVAALALGDLRHDAAGWFLPLLRASGTSLSPHDAVAVAESADGVAWAVRDLWEVPATTTQRRASVPAATSAPDGTRYVVWSDTRSVRLASGRSGRWSSPVVVRTAGAAILPSVVAANGRVAVAHYLAPRGSDADADATWRPAVTVVGSPTRTTAGPALSGRVCLSTPGCDGAPDGADAGAALARAAGDAASLPGPVRLVRDASGVVRLAYAVAPGYLGAGAAVVATQVACVDLGLGGQPGCGAGVAAPVPHPPVADPGPPVPPPQADPDLPTCSAPPPPFPRSAPRPRPRPRDPAPGAGTPEADRPRGRRPLSGLVPFPPVAVPLPPYAAPGAQGVQQIQQGNAAQHAAQAQPGVATREDEEAQVVEEYAFSRRHEADPRPLLYGAALTAAAAVAVRTRTRRALAPAASRRARRSP